MNLFNFTFHLQTSLMNGEVIICMVFGENYSEACNRVLNLGLPIVATCEKDLKDSIREVIQCDNEEETTEGN